MTVRLFDKPISFNTDCKLYKFMEEALCEEISENWCIVKYKLFNNEIDNKKIITQLKNANKNELIVLIRWGINDSLTDIEEMNNIDLTMYKEEIQNFLL